VSETETETELDGAIKVERMKEEERVPDEQRCAVLKKTRKW
jgi:hypothetical protein